MTTLVITCRTCGRAHTPSPEDIRAGRWRICADCHEPGRSPPNPTRLNVL